MADNENENQQQQSEWLIAIQDELEKARLDNEALCARKPCIYKVPRYLRESNKKCYTPNVVSIGPYHHQNRHLHPMERHKWRAFYQTINRNKHNFKLYLDSIKELEARARACYEGEINLNTNDFVKMMVLDGCFILELFRGTKDGFEELGYTKGDPVFSICGSLDSIRRDMVKLENQIPMFILDALLALQTGEGHDTHELAKMAISFFAPLIPTDEPLHKDRAFSQFDPQPLHCLHLFRESLVSKGLILPKRTKKLWKRKLTRNVVGKPTTQVTYCVSQLRESGIRFKKRETDQFWDIKYKSSILEIPRILIHDGTKSIFRNLVAFEECHPECSNEITAYLVFMNNLIDSAEDVAYLHYKGIIEHWLGNHDDVADLFNGLCQEVVADLNDSYLSGLTDDINKCRDKRWSNWKADFRHKYFRNPWALISVIAGVVLLLITVLQAFYDVFSYYKPTS
ncbi:hypothetical protein CTI12_AA134830 [Artemisia annua]|uniref:PH domain-containing protein n=1 Tax=Artemisia annua TaxID=35608 RepID=A0A2U1PE38_ARTAN|nr:hypothetical protein CTI12_AA134830 [Artemisia annua]